MRRGKGETLLLGGGGGGRGTGLGTRPVVLKSATSLEEKWRKRRRGVGKGRGQTSPYEEGRLSKTVVAHYGKKERGTKERCGSHHAILRQSSKGERTGGGGGRKPNSRGSRTKIGFLQSGHQRRGGKDGRGDHCEAGLGV